MNENAADILKAMQLILESTIDDATRQLHNLKAISANIGYAITLLADKEV